MTDPDRLFAHGNPNPDKFGWSLRSSAGKAPDPKRIEDTTAQLGRPAFQIDEDGYECEIIGGAVHESGALAYVETRSKDVGYNQHGAHQRKIDISIRVHSIDLGGKHDSADIESYNPFFGCDIRFFEWIADTAILIYREKHWTFACRFGNVWPPRFVKIEDRWIINRHVLGYIGYKEKSVRRLSFPLLDEMDSVSMTEADRLGQLPPDPYAT